MRRTGKRKQIALAVAACFVASSALANPTGPTVVNGTASIVQNGKLLSITNSPNAIINWQSFSIGANEVTRFIQQSQASAVLNRVTGAAGVIDPSVILGALQSNGRVFLINPSGILFGAGAQVDVAGLVATSLNLTNADFLANRLRFTDVPGAGSVINQGNITTGPGGSVYLVGPAVTNSGIITSPQGEVILAAGNSVELVSPGTPSLRVEISAPDNEARNLGQIVVDSGRAGIYAGLINQSGAIRANGAVAEGGKILLKATKNATLEAGSVTTANGASGGSVTVQSGDTTLVSGSVEAKGASGQGGSVQVLGNRVGVIGTASLDASGDAGGGSVLVGGDFQGKNPDVQNAFRTYVGSDATLKADAITSGDGGKVIVWSDDTTRFYGNISARGGNQSGNGGLVEVSGKEFLDFNGRVNVGAPAGRSGTILLDPRDIIIQDAAGPDDGQVLDGAALFADGGTADFTISDEALEGLTGNVVLQAQRDIIVQNGLSGGLNFANQSAGERVVFQAGENIRIGSPLTTAGAAILLEADSPHTRATAGIVPNGEGNIRIDTGANITSNGGAITLISGRSVNKGGFELGADVNAGNGGINVSITNDESAGAPGAPSDFIMGATGSSHLANNEVSRLQAGAAGTLTLGEATTAGDNGLGGGTARLLKVNSIMQDTSTATNVPAASGGALRLVAGSGGITLARNLGTFQTTEFNTDGSLNLSAALNTNNNPLTITALGGINIAGGSITTGTGLFTCSSPSGCPSTSVVVNSWNVDASGDWSVGTNWLLGVPTAGQVVLIDRPSGAYTITLGSAGQGTVLTEGVGLLVNNESLNLVGNASFKTTLNIGSSLVYGGTTASSNTGTMTLTNSVLGGSGRLANEGTFQLTNSSVGAGFSNRAALATLTANATNAFTSGLTILDGTVNIASGTTAVSGTGLVQSGGAATVPSGATLSASIYDLSGTGSIGGTGDFAVTTHYSQTGGALGTTFSDLALRKIGNFNVGATGFTAVDSVRLVATGDIVLNGPVTASVGTGDAVVLAAGGNFLNNVGPAVLNSGAGRWLVYSTSPAGSTENGLTAMADPAAPRLYGRSYGANPPATIAQPGSHLIYSAQPSLTITADNKSKIYGGADPALTYTLSGFVNDDGILDTALTAGLSGAAALSTATGSAATAGTHIISASQGSLASGSGYTFATPVNGALSVGKVVLTVTADDKSKTYGTADPTLTYTANAGQLFYGDTAAVVSGVSLTASTGAAATAGTHTITASGGTAANYNITTANGTLTVGQATLMATADNKSKTYGSVDPALTYTVGGTLFYGDTASVVAGVSLAAPTGAAATAGAHTITASGGTAANYAVTMANGTLTVGQASLTATADNKSKTYGAADPALTYTVGGTLFYGDTAAVVSGVSLTAPAGAAATAGTHTITASGGMAANYAVTMANGALTVGKASLTATADNKSKTYGAADPALTYTVGGTLFYGDSASVVSSVSLGAPTGAAATAGTHTITASGGTAANYAVTAGNGTLTVGKAALTVAADLKTKVYGDADPALTYLASGFQYSDSAGSVLTGGLTRAVGETVAGGPYAINPGTLAANGNYTVSYTPNTLSITPATLTYLANTGSREYGDANPAFTGSVSGFKLADTLGTAMTGTLSFTSPALPGSNVGSYAINGGGLTANNGNYTFVQDPANTAALTINPATLTYLASAASRERGDANPALGGTVTGFKLGQNIGTATTGTLAFGSPATPSAIEGQYAINGSGLTALNGNYTFVQAPANTTALTITPPVNFTWTSAGGGAWETGSNWNKGFAPVDGAVVTIPDLGPAGPSATISYSSATTNVKTLTSSEGLTIAGGNLNLGSGGADASAFLGGAPVALTGGMLGINAGATLAVSTLTLNGGTLHGAGAVIGNVSNLAGTVAAGSSIGTLTINGNYVQGPAGTLGIEVGGTNQYDVLNVTGNVTLDGTLAVTLLNNFVPPLNETYTVIQSGGAISGSLGVSSAQSAPAFRAAYLPSSLNLIVGASAVVPLLTLVDGGQILVASTDLSVTSQSETSISLEDKKKEEKEKSEMQKKHSCTGAAVVSDAGGVAVFGGGGSRCTSRGCF